MNNPIQLRGPQVMINEIFERKIKFMSILKWLLVFSVLGFMIHFPDVIIHGILWAVHTFYEATSFLLEEFLRHTFGFDKDLAQLIVFYFSVIVGVGVTILFWRYWLRDYLVFKFHEFKYQAIYYWASRRKIEKIKLILIHSAFMVSAFMFLLS